MKVALVTGAGSGIGRACSVRLAREGHVVGVLDLDEARCAGTIDEIVAAGGQAIALGADISERAQVRAALTRLREAFGPVTILVNNAGIAEFLPFEVLTDDQWDRMFRINVRGAFIVTQELVPDMKAANWGRIVNISSSSAQTGTRVQVHYAASKGAIISLTRSLAEDLGPYGITVNNIPPGSIMGTIMSEANRDRFPVPVEAMIAAMPVRRMGVPDDIANACAWLIQDESGYITGQTIGVNGGRVVS